MATRRSKHGTPPETISPSWQHYVYYCHSFASCYSDSPGAKSVNRISLCSQLLQSKHLCVSRLHVNIEIEDLRRRALSLIAADTTSSFQATTAKHGKVAFRCYWGPEILPAVLGVTCHAEALLVRDAPPVPSPIIALFRYRPLGYRLEHQQCKQEFSRLCNCSLTELCKMYSSSAHLRIYVALKMPMLSHRRGNTDSRPCTFPACAVAIIVICKVRPRRIGKSI